MTHPIEFREIPLFRYFDAETRLELPQRFTPQDNRQGDVIISYGKPVPGIFIIAEGEATVTIPNAETPLAILKSGQCFGEMSLVEESETASASVTILTKQAKLLFCSTGEFKKLLLSTPGCAYAFYKGAALLLSSRLRHVNSKVNEVISTAHGLIDGFLNDSLVPLHLTETMSEVNETGANVVGKLMQVMPVLTDLQKKFPQAQADLENLRQVLEEVFLVDGQNFDRITQQLDLIFQQFENIKRVAHGGATIPLAGDKNIFKKSSSR